MVGMGTVDGDGGRWVWGQWVASMSRCAIIARLGGAALVMVTLMNSNQSFCATMCER